MILEPGVLIAVNIGNPEIMTVVRNDDAIRLLGLDVTLDRCPVATRVLIGVLIDPEQIDLAIFGQQLRKLLLDGTNVITLSLEG